MRFIRRTGVYENIQKKRWEYWVVYDKNIFVMVSWLSWSASATDYKMWESQQLSNAG
jgi:hypothetical protein